MQKWLFLNTEIWNQLYVAKNVIYIYIYNLCMNISNVNVVFRHADVSTYSTCFTEPTVSQNLSISDHIKIILYFIVFYLCKTIYSNNTWPKLISKRSHQTDNHFILNASKVSGNFKVMFCLLILFNLSGRNNIFFWYGYEINSPVPRSSSWPPKKYAESPYNKRIRLSKDTFVVL